MRTCGLVTAGECGSRLNAERNVYEKKESGNRQSHGRGPMSNKELAHRETLKDTLHCTGTGYPRWAAVTLPGCNCGCWNRLARTRSAYPTTYSRNLRDLHGSQCSSPQATAGRSDLSADGCASGTYSTVNVP